MALPGRVDCQHVKLANGLLRIFGSSRHESADLILLLGPATQTWLEGSRIVLLTSCARWSRQSPPCSTRATTSPSTDSIDSNTGTHARREALRRSRDRSPGIHGYRSARLDHRIRSRESIPGGLCEIADGRISRR